ncbi:MAG TPA: hypothetical protein VN814_11925 [Caulobacteraceae bacterium]|nr:hypothetical protein [Caulobacteraceae bacterium]
MTNLIVEKRGLDIGRALGDAFRVIGRRWPGMLTLVLLAAWAPQMLLILSYAPVVVRWGPLAYSLWTAIGFVLVVLFFALLMRTAVTTLALAPGQDVSTPRALAIAVAAIPTLAPLWLIGSAPEVARTALPRLTHYSFANQSVIGAALTWPIAVTLALTLGVVTSVAVAERRGFVATVSRTFRLMSGGRWAFLGLYLVFQLLAGVSAIGVPLLLGALSVSASSNVSWLRSTSFELVSDLWQALWAVVAAMCYRQFRRQLDGPTPGEAADIFS